MATLGDKRSGRTGSERLSVSLSLILFSIFIYLFVGFVFFWGGVFYFNPSQAVGHDTWLVGDFKRKCHLFVVFLTS